MASITVNGFDDVLKKLEKLSDKSKVDEIAKKAVNAAKGSLLSSTKSAVASSEYGTRSTGSVASSISATDAKVNQYGVFAVARPTGRDARGVSNGAKAGFLEYGTPTMAARSWRDTAASSAESSCKSTMENIVKAEMELE